MKKALLPLVLSSFFASTAANAEITFNGFASVIAGMTGGDDQIYLDYDDGLSFKNESKFALQASAPLGDGLSATAQMIARGSDDFAVEFEWAFLNYALSDYTQLKAGRIRMPFYYYSEFVDVGYAYHWLRAPDSVYNVPFNSWEGAAIVNTHTIGRADGQFQFQIGAFDDPEFQIPGDDERFNVEFEGIAAEYVLSYANIAARLGYIKVSNLNLDAPEQLLNAISGDGVPQAYRDNILLEDDDADYLSASLFYNNGAYFIGVEGYTLDYDLGINPDEEGAYITGGLRHNDWVFHLTYQIQEVTPRSHSELFEGAPVELFDTYAPLTESFTSAGFLAGLDSTAISIGVNYHFNPSAVFKIDYTTYDDDVNAPGGEVDADLLSFGVDMVF